MQINVATHRTLTSPLGLRRSAHLARLPSKQHRTAPNEQSECTAHSNKSHKILLSTLCRRSAQTPHVARRRPNESLQLTRELHLLPVVPVHSFDVDVLLETVCCGAISARMGRESAGARGNKEWRETHRIQVHDPIRWFCNLQRGRCCRREQSQPSSHGKDE